MGEVEGGTGVACHTGSGPGGQGSGGHRCCLPHLRLACLHRLLAACPLAWQRARQRLSGKVSTLLLLRRLLGIRGDHLGLITRLASCTTTHRIHTHKISHSEPYGLTDTMKPPTAATVDYQPPTPSATSSCIITIIMVIINEKAIHSGGLNPHGHHSGGLNPHGHHSGGLNPHLPSGHGVTMVKATGYTKMQSQRE